MTLRVSMWLRLAVIACLFLSTAAFAAETPECPQWRGAHPNAAKARAFVCESGVAELEKYFVQRHRDYEAGQLDAGQLLWTYDQLWEPFPFERLEEWLRRYPDSYPAHLAMAEALIKRAFSLSDTAVPWYLIPQKMVGVYMLQRHIDGVLERSLSLNTKPFLSYYYLIRAERVTRPWFWRRDSINPRPAAQKYMDKAAQVDGPAFPARAAYMISLEPRRGGNVRAMRRHYEDSQNAGLNEAQLGRLQAMVLFEESALLDPDKAGAERLQMAMRANELYEDTRYLRDIIWLKIRARRWADALPELNRAVELTPRDAWVRDRRANAYFVLKRHPEAYQDFLVLAKQGNAFAQNKIGWYLTMGVGVPQDKREGAQWFAKSAAGGNPDGINNLKKAREEGSI